MTNLGTEYSNWMVLIGALWAGEDSLHTKRSQEVSK